MRLIHQRVHMRTRARSHTHKHRRVYPSFRTESITKYTLTTINFRWEETKRVMAVKLTRLTHKIAIQLHLVAKSCTICISSSRRPVRKLLDTSIVYLLFILFCVSYILEDKVTVKVYFATWCKYEELNNFHISVGKKSKDKHMARFHLLSGLRIRQ
jgi:hypothetical protein